MTEQGAGRRIEAGGGLTSGGTSARGFQQSSRAMLLLLSSWSFLRNPGCQIMLLLHFCETVE